MSAKTIRLASAMSLLLLASAGSAEIFKTVDANGNVSFSDKAPEGSEAVDLKPANTLPAVSVPEAAAGEQEAEEGAASYSTLRIASPADDSAVEHGPGDFKVSVDIQPDLAKGHALQLYLNGAAYGAPSNRASFMLRGVDRGTHKLQVRILDDKGYSLKKSGTISVHVFRPSVLAPGYRR